MITNKLTSSSRKSITDRLLRHTHIGFSAANAHAIAIWIVKNASAYFDSQLIELVNNIKQRASEIKYKSNQQTFRNEQVAHNRAPDGVERYSLDCRLVLVGVGGIEYDIHNVPSLSDRAADMLNDICTIAQTIGFYTDEYATAKSLLWESGRANHFFYTNLCSLEKVVLMEVRAFNNGNLHLKLNQHFIGSLNKEFRLLMER
jgi:hypothetical protein